MDVGRTVAVGCAVGSIVGTAVGCAVAVDVGATVGCAVAVSAGMAVVTGASVVVGQSGRTGQGAFVGQRLAAQSGVTQGDGEEIGQQASHWFRLQSLEGLPQLPQALPEPETQAGAAKAKDSAEQSMEIQTSREMNFFDMLSILS